MALSDATLSILDGQLASLPPSIANSMVSLGICSAGVPNTLYSIGNTTVAQSSLGQGPLTEGVVDALAVAGGPALAMPLNPTTPGTVGSVTHDPALGSGTVTPSRAPAVSIAVKITTGGTLGTAAFAISLAGGSYSAPVVTVAGSSFAYLVPGTNTTITLTAATYVLNDVYTVATTGVITVVGTGPAGNVTQVSSPLDVYDVRVTITTGGALGTAVFTYSLDGGNNVSAQILVPSGSGIYAIPGTGVVLTFASTFVAADGYKFTTTTASFNNTDVTNAYTALLAAPLEWSLSHVIGMGSNSAAAASLAATVESQMVLAMAGFRYVHSVIECPTSESDSTVATTFANFSSAFGRVSVVAGDGLHQSSISGRSIRRNLGIGYASRLAAIRPAESPARQKTGPIQNYTKIFRDERATPFLDANRFVTAGQEVGVSGFFFVSGNTMAAGGSDYAEIMNGRVMDMSCRIVRSAALTYLNDDLTVGPNGGIYEPVAEAIQSFINGELTAGVVNTNNASPLGQGKSMVLVDTTNPILTDKTIRITVRILPKGYGKFISITIGFTNPAAGG